MAERKQEPGATHENTWGATEEVKSTFAKRAGKAQDADKESPKSTPPAK